MRAGEELAENSGPGKQLLRISFARLLVRAAELREGPGGRAVALREGADPSPLVPIRVPDRTCRPSLVLVHPVGGSAASYFRLARFLAPAQPVYAIENQVAFTPGARSFDSIESMAAAYLDLLVGHGIAPPYVLGGYSMGGLVAFEMARRLASTDTPVRLVAIIDTPVAVAPSPPGTRAEELTAQDVLTLATIITGPVGVHLDLDRRELETAAPDGRIGLLIAALRARGILPPQIDNDMFRRIVASIRANDLAQRRFRPEPYGGDVALFRAAEHSAALAEEAGAAYDDPAFGWQPVCARPVRIVAVPGDHLRLFDEPSVRHLGAALQEAIDRAAGPDGSEADR